MMTVGTPNKNQIQKADTNADPAAVHVLCLPKNSDFLKVMRDRLASDESWRVKRTD